MAKKKGKQAKDRVPNYVKEEAKLAKLAEKKQQKKEWAKQNPKQVAFLNRMRLLRKIGFWTVGVLLTLVLIAGILAAVYEDDIAKALVKEVNKNLKQPIEVKSIDLTLIRSFPNASVDFRAVRVPDALGKTLLRAEKMAFKFNIWSLLGKNSKVKSIVIDDGFLRISTDASGNSNYDIFNTETETEASSDEVTPFAVSLERTILKNIVLKYSDENKETAADILLEYLDLSGNLSNETTKLKSYAEIVSHSITIQGDKYFPEAIISWNFGINADFKNNTYTLENSKLDIEANTFEVVGSVRQDVDFDELDLHLKGDDCTIRSVIAVLPDRYKSIIKDFNSKGNFYFNVDVEGFLGLKKTPAFSAAFGLKNGQITSPRLGESLKQVNFDALLFSKQDWDSSSFTMNGFEAVLDKKLLNIDLAIANIKDPRIDFRFNGDVNLGLVYKLSDNPYIKNGSGLIKVQDLIVEGRYKDMITPSRLSRIDASGIVSTEQFKLTYKNELFRMRDGYVTFTNDLVTVRALKLFGADSDFLLNINLYNVIPIVLADSAQLTNIKMRFEGELQSDNINFDKLLALGLEENPNQKTPAPVSTDTSLTEKGLDYTGFVEGSFSTNIRKFNFRKVNGNNFSGTVLYKNKEVIFQNVGVDAMDGRIQLNSSLRLQGAPKLEAFVECDDIDGERFFREGENFGQKELTDKNVKGRLDAKILVNAFWDENFNFLDDKLYALIDLTIRDGELVDFKMMEDFSKLVKIEDLKNIKFTDVRNQLRIQNNQLTIPTMFIQSNAVNLTMAGTYGFNNDVNFSFKINAGQAIAQKFGRFKNYKAIKANRSGWLNMYVGMVGNLYGDLKLDYTDKKNVLNAFNNTLKSEFVDIQHEIQTKFNIQTVVEPDGWDDDETDDDGAFDEF